MSEMPDTGSVGELRRIAMGVEYDGTAYAGWQTQPHAPSVQDALEAALSKVADSPVSTVAAGRTDAGVHATGQVVHFDSDRPRSCRSWVLGANSNLPDDISVLWAVPVSTAFHARFSALARSYRYLIVNRQVRPALDRHRSWWLHSALDLHAMREAAAHLLGRHDFSAFRAAACQSHTAVRELRRLNIRADGDRVEIDCTANAFLHHMVRNIVGSLVRVGRGEADPGWILRLLQDRDRRLAGMTAPACGLTLRGVRYPADSGVPPEGFAASDD